VARDVKERTEIISKFEKLKTGKDTVES
jgi:hypothetical protein